MGVQNENFINITQIIDNHHMERMYSEKCLHILYPVVGQLSSSGESKTSQIAGFMGPTWGPSGAYRTQVGLMLAPWTLLSGLLPYHRTTRAVCGSIGSKETLCKYEYQIWRSHITYEAMSAEKFIWLIFVWKVGQRDPIAMKLKRDASCHLLDVYSRL